MIDVMHTRSAMLLGEEAMNHLGACRVAVFGLGGVGGFAAEALVRSGIGAIDLIDGDVVAHSNLNRQLVATNATIGQSKAELMRERALAINPGCRAVAIHAYYTADTMAQFDLSRYDYILDCVDMVSAKLLLAVEAQRLHIPIISAMGAGNKLDPTLLRIADISQSSVCPLARVMRKALRQRGIDRLTVAYSTEQPLKPAACLEPSEPSPRRATPGSMIFVPGAMGLAMASHAIRALMGQANP